MNFTAFLSKRSIKFNISLLLGLVSVLLIVILISYSIFKLRQVQIDNSIATAQNLTEKYSGQIKSDLDEAVQTAEVVSNSFASIKNPSAQVKLSRDQAIAMLKEVLLSKKNLAGTWTIWEPDAFDNNDVSYINSIGNDSLTGRFVPYWTPNPDGTVALSSLTDFEDENNARWYYVPKSTSKEYIYALDYAGTHMISACMPILYNGKFYGVVGADITLDTLQNLAKGIKKNIFDGRSIVTITNQEDKVVAHSETDKFFLKDATKVFTEFKDLANNKEKSSYFIKNDTLVAFAPIFLGKDKSNWQVAIRVPMSEITASTWTQLYIYLAIGIIFIIIWIFVADYIIKKLTNPIFEIANAAENIAVGDLTYNEVEVTSTELAVLNEAFTKLVKSQQHITEVCVGISEGDFSLQAQVKGEKDTLGGSVNKMISNLKTAAIEDSKRNWISDGLAKFSEILRENNDFEKLTSSIISELVKYVKANQGGLFVLEDGVESNLQLVASYAYDRRKYIKRTIALNEGLVGQCYLEKSRIYLTDVPSNYVYITSGVGKATPRCVLIVPLLVNEKVEGVIEIASFQKFEEHEIAFVEKIAESIASTLSNIKINIQTAKLLSETQEQSEQMRSQEEEMRQNLEEMTSIQEEMQRKEYEYISRIQELEADIQEYKYR